MAVTARQEAVSQIRSTLTKLKDPWESETEGEGMHLLEPRVLDLS
jgi:hypothetical protein